MCCPSKLCCLCILLVLAVVLIGFLFGFGVFSHGFHKLKDNLHLDDSLAHANASTARPLLGAPAPF